MNRAVGGEENNLGARQTLATPVLIATLLLAFPAEGIEFPAGGRDLMTWQLRTSHTKSNDTRKLKATSDGRSSEGSADEVPAPPFQHRAPPLSAPDPSTRA